jgi:hypothetical protein
MRRTLGVIAACVIAGCAPRERAASPDDLREALQASVRVSFTDGRFVNVQVDTVPSTVSGASLINRYPRMYAYLVQHQLAPERLFDGVTATADDPRLVLIANLLADSGATRTFLSYLTSVTASAGAKAGPVPMVAEREVLHVAARFFHPVVMGPKQVAFFRCAGINGMQGLGLSRNQAIEAFAFWGLAPAIFDADSSSDVARALDAEFAEAKAGFRLAAQAASTPEQVERATAELYAAMERSAALRRILREAYGRAAPDLPFSVHEWTDGPA